AVYNTQLQGIKGWSGEDTTVIGNEEEARNFSMEKPKKICIVSQTTFNYNKFKYLVEIISKKRYDINVLDTICNATHERQAEAKKIAANVDSMIVIGGKNSSNTQKLYEICSKECSSTYYIQTLEDMNLCELQSSSCVGITAGASTPNYIIEEVHNNVRKF
ncbi:MAG: 4-hydroxy-3-methylbut-2-enyl diphosphate reductase, partial [Lachnospiraceae bacterium]|nr:4-hydroxy-3-methylbut-2-enyl diphosphate reductase [Lachnospiraceae bacterium]